MLLRLSTSLHYPITVTELLKRPGDTIQQGETIFAYYYRTTVTEGDGLGNKHDVLKTFPTRFESAVDGELVAWKVREGAVIEGPIDIAEIHEPCSHEVQFGGMCANCGKDMTEFNYNTEVLDSSRAPIRMVHDNSALTVSENEATRVEEDAKRRLLSSRRLSLVVDLDQTIIHATVDPTVAEWQQDKDNPNHEAVKDVRAFQLVDDGPGMRGCWYYIKLRPGLEEFLREISTLFELHIYTMGTRAYAQHIANIVDPDRKIFGDRILSRDESGSLTAKNLQRLFPVDTKMVVIIDDRGDVWKWTDNLIKVLPYDFFVGIGDINSSFLPKKQEFKGFPRGAAKAKREADSKEAEAAGTTINGSGAMDVDGKTATEVSALEQLVTMGGGDNPVLLQEQANEQEEAIAHQVEERPLLQKQKQLDAEDEAAELMAAAENGDSSSDDSHDSSRHRHHLLEDNDTELYKLEERLKAVHKAFFDEYDRRRTSSLGGRVSALRGERVPTRDRGIDLRIVPDIKVIMPQIKRPVLNAVVLVFSGVLPLGTDTQNADISLWAKSFGAAISTKISSRTTHLVAGRNRTAKVREATRYPNIKIVTVQWLLDSITQWKRVDEEPYLVPVHPEDRGELIGGSDNVSPADDSAKSNGSIDDYSFLSSSEEDDSMADDDDDDGDGNSTIETGSASKLRLRTTNNDLRDIDEEILQSAGLTEHSLIGYDAEQQAAVHDELRAFLGSDNDDSESDSDLSLQSSSSSFSAQQQQQQQGGKKRKRGPESEGSGGESSAGEGEGGDGGERTAAAAAAGAGAPSGSSRLAQKIKLSHERNTGLKNVATIRSRGSSEAPPTSVSGAADAGAGAGAGATPPLRNHPPNAEDDDDIGDESDTTEYNNNEENNDVDPEDDDDALEREMLAAFEDGGWGEEEEEGVGEGEEEETVGSGT
ncbi:RNA polymerase II CTD phosphatase Fcp1 [Blastomyces gilchristii SLH14081]|uniref:RNA polymerase II subunit A C-terminal domain phosphatase n=1 Tax=Blastomyces gilchristii (strain SLH14081) TaxID=559298 RepID=A0A179UTA6_BLAGS|nr:RNA polymerase II CTD phosphatase Fcp1 [Blastomyces gilchristii SLH14081]OAT10459.1 RNA polymerase II CTD phosphatase Fcp1 [Blastomyces gilchristii SLH14081]